MALEVAARPSAPEARPRSGARQAWPVLAALAAVAVLVRVGAGGDVGWARNLLVVFGSLLVEAFPFVALGAAVSAAIEVFVPSSTFGRIASLPGPMQLPAAALAGVAFPVCECGSVPVARRLARKGLQPGAAIAFMLAAPILNPVVIASTVVAFRGRESLWLMVGGRLALGFLAAVAVGWVVGARRRPELLRAIGADVDESPVLPDAPRRARFFGHLAGDLLFMGKFLVFGAILAATIQTFVPQTWVDGLSNLPVLGLLAMMALAALMSLCSESDAFVAASFTGIGAAGQLAFLVFGPMVDLKLGALYAGTFTKGVAREIVIGVAAVTLVGTMWIAVMWG